MNDEYYNKDGSAPPEERAELQRIQQEGFEKKLAVGMVRAYVLSPDGHPYDLVATDTAAATLASLGRAVAQFKPQPGSPVVRPGPQSTPPPAAADALAPHLIARGDDRGSWGEFPAESWIVLNREDWSKLLPSGAVTPGQTWDLDQTVSAKILTYFYPQTENNDARIDRIEQQSLTAKALTLKGGVTTARVDGFVKMHLYPGRKDAQPIEAQVVGLLIFAPGQPPTIELTTTRALRPSSTRARDFRTCPTCSSNGTTLPISALESARVGTVTGTLSADRTGDHWQQGLLLGRGPQFPRGEIATVRTQDVAPILLDLLGVAIPAHYEGRSALAWRPDRAARSAPSTA